MRRCPSIDKELSRVMNSKRIFRFWMVTLLLLSLQTVWSSDWPSWRGPEQNGVSEDTGLVSSWSQDGENLIWKAELTGRSTPVVIDGRVCANGRAGEGINRQETVVCFDAESGRKLWEHRFAPYHTTVPWNRVGWANLTGDPETGYIYAQGVGGTFLCFDRNGVVVWSRSLVEDLGFFSGYGGRTQTPIVDEDRLIVTFASASWGEWSAPRHRTFAFDKRTGELLWVSTPGKRPADLNSQSTPVVAVVDGQRLLIQGNGDGFIYALQARTGKKVWQFQMSKRAINTTVVVSDGVVYATHSEENPDGGSMGRVVAFRASGQGDITATNEIWRSDVSAGFSSPLLHAGRLYVVDNSANMHALDAETGRELWEFNLGTVGKGSPVVADGKIFVGEVNGRFHILQPGADGAISLDVEELSVPGGRYAEIYGSPSIAYGRIYFTTEGGIYCLGDRTKPFRRASSREASGSTEAAAPPGGKASILTVSPAEIVIGTDGSAEFTVHAFDALGRALGERNAEWTLDGLAGLIDASGRFRPESRQGIQFGHVVARADGVSAQARVRVFGELSLSEDYESVALDGRPPYMLGALARFAVKEVEGNKVLVKSPSPVGIHRQNTYLGPVTWTGYTIQADLLGTKTRRKVPDMGLINSGYTLDLMGVHQQIQIRSWTSELRMATQVPFSWQPGIWYSMKMRVDIEGEKAIIRGKVWQKSDTEPAEWTITAEDPHPITQGSPGLYGYSPTPIYYDNVRITASR